MNLKVWIKLKEFDFLYIVSDRCENYCLFIYYLLICWLRNGLGNEDICSKYIVVLFFLSGKIFLKFIIKNIIVCIEFFVFGVWCLYWVFRY